MSWKGKLMKQKKRLNSCKIMLKSLKKTLIFIWIDCNHLETLIRFTVLSVTWFCWYFVYLFLILFIKRDCLTFKKAHLPGFIFYTRCFSSFTLFMFLLKLKLSLIFVINHLLSPVFLIISQNISSNISNFSCVFVLTSYVEIMLLVLVVVSSFYLYNFWLLQALLCFFLLDKYHLLYLCS